LHAGFRRDSSSRPEALRATGANRRAAPKGLPVHRLVHEMTFETDP